MRVMETLFAAERLRETFWLDHRRRTFGALRSGPEP